jgi:hypothetical protein
MNVIIQNRLGFHDPMKAGFSLCLQAFSAGMFRIFVLPSLFGILHKGLKNMIICQRGRMVGRDHTLGRNKYHDLRFA